MSGSKPDLIERGWRSFAEHVVPAKASPADLQELRKVFFSGAIWMFGALLDAVGPDAVDEAAGMRVLDGLQAEVEAFISERGRGRR